MNIITLTLLVLLFFFFKQKTAYEMRISDWSSDVCSSDLQADRRDARLVVERDLVDTVDDAGAAQHGVLAARHRRGAGMAFGAGDGDLEPAHALDALHDADGALIGLEDRALLDMRLEKRLERPAADRHVAEIADPLQLLADGLAVEIGAAVAVFLGEHAGKDARGHHGRGKPRARSEEHKSELQS